MLNNSLTVQSDRISDAERRTPSGHVLVVGSLSTSSVSDMVTAGGEDGEDGDREDEFPWYWPCSGVAVGHERVRLHWTGLGVADGANDGGEGWKSRCGFRLIFVPRGGSK